MPRAKLAIPTVMRIFRIPVNLMAIVETMFYDPLKKRPKYGAVNDYVIGLIREDLRRRGLLS